MKITEVTLTHTEDSKPTKQSIQNSHSDSINTFWRTFPRWDMKTDILDEKVDKTRIIAKLGENLICQSTFSGKHHITYWKYYKTREEYEEDNIQNN